MPGVVVRALGHHYEVETDDGIRLCRVRGRLLQERSRENTLVAVGDRVEIVPEGKKKGQIDAVDERDSVLSRQRPGSNRPAEDVILANPDQVLIVFAAAQPEPHTRMLDRFLVIAEANELPAIICVNKIDLTGLEKAREIFGVYEALGYPLLYASVTEGRGLHELHELLEDRLTVVTGPSGVGKSALINALHPGLNLRVGDLRDFEGKGQHTTRSAQLIRLPFGAETYIADTPGIRELGLYEIDPGSLAFYFVEMKPFIHDCHFPNCTHTHEPSCAVRAAVERGDISAERYDSYLRVLDGEDLQLEEW
ncbi:MAG: ribosome small subunit-dependent GTPase A [Chloroflexi bacterium]|nr:ribosome small subunit-dependent GTPase A [Chloroflexota bacterium]